MGACFSVQKQRKSRQKPENKNPPERPSSTQSQISQVEQYVVIEQGQRPPIGQMEERLRSPNDWMKYIDRKVEENTKKSLKRSPDSQQIVPQYQLPQQIVQFIQTSQNRSILRQKQHQSESRIGRQSKKSFYIKNSFIADLSEGIQSIKSSIVTQLLQEESEILDVITNQAKMIYESKFQKQLLSTEQFKAKLLKIKLIQQQPAKDFKFLSLLGRGSMCRVYKACKHNKLFDFYAVRIISIQSGQILEKLKQEITVMTLCQSWNIIKYYFSYYFQKTLFMFIEFMDYGSLNHFIGFYGKGIQERVITYIIRQILKGLNSIHKRRQVHRDLKSDNILINRNGQIKIGDFGYAIQLTKDSQYSREIAGTPAWMAPELIKKEQYTESVDIWSLGIILVELCQGQPKYLKLNPYMAMIMIATKSPETVTDRSQLLQVFLSRCLQKDPQLRATTKQLLGDPFIASIGEGLTERQIFLDMLKQLPNNFQ